MLFTGTLRKNLDPTDEYDDASVWNALELVNLKTYVVTLTSGLQYKVTENGSNFRFVAYYTSAGFRSARARSQSLYGGPPPETDSRPIDNQKKSNRLNAALLNSLLLITSVAL